jgi:hypothetical protein
MTSISSSATGDFSGTIPCRSGFFAGMIGGNSNSMRAAIIGQLSRPLRAALFVIPAIVTLRWPLPIVAATLRGEGIIDRTVLAFIAPFVLMLIGLPGFVAAAAGRRGETRSAQLWIRASILLVVVSAALVLVWMWPAVLTMRSTLKNPIMLIVWIAPPIATLILATRLRFGLVR